MIGLTKAQIVELHMAIYKRYGGDHGVLNEGMLDSALQAPFQRTKHAADATPPRKAMLTQFTGREKRSRLMSASRVTLNDPSSA